MSRLEMRFLDKLGTEWEAATPGLCVQAYSKGKKIVDVEVGETFPIYDWASLTKIVFTTTALMTRFDEKRFRLQDPVSRWVSWFPEDQPARLKDLLCHSAGLTWWYPFYKEVSRKTPKGAKPEEAWEIFQNVLKRKILADFRKNQNPGNEKSVYSDLDYFLLGIALESVSGTTLYTVWSEMRERMGLKDTDFIRGNQPKLARSQYAPTEKDQAFRKKTMQGEVHDENTWSLKGVAPHAGLFGPIEDLSRFGLLLRSAMQGKKSRHFPTPETVARFAKRAIPRAKGDWALGFMMPSRETPSCGRLFSPQSIGHTGFTGTSLWYDPKKDLLITILSNRVHPTRDNRAFVALRPKLHTLIAEELK